MHIDFLSRGIALPIPYLTAIQVNPGTPSVAAGRTQQFTAMGTFSRMAYHESSRRIQLLGEGRGAVPTPQRSGEILALHCVLD
jgi:hypothetical protein